MKKKILTAFIIACTLIMAMGIINASARTYGFYGDLDYEVSDGEVMITGCDEDATSVIIPSTIMGYPVTSIGQNAFSICDSLTDITIGDSVTSIGVGAFSYCDSLTSITIPDSVTIIGHSAFSGCESLTSITIPDSVTSIGDYAFSDCNSLTSITIGNSVTSIGDSAFEDCSNLTSITIGDSVTSIGYDAFSGCSSLTDITIGDSVTSIGVGAFRSCSSLTSITIPDSVTSIREHAFYYCSSLTSITIPNSVTSIGYGAFYCCDNIKTVYYTGTQEEWNKIVVSPLDEAEVIFNYVIPSVESEIIGATSIDTTLKFISKAIIEGEPEIATFGTTFIPLWLFEVGSSDTATVEYNNADYNIQNGQTFGATLTDIPESFKDTKIVGKSYIKTTDGNYKWSTAKYATVNNTTLKTIE